MNPNTYFDPLALPQTRPVNAPDFFHVMAKPTGAICNLDCEYCFFLSKEALYPGSPFRMADDVLEIYLKQMIESQHGSQVTIAWQGGEPTLMGLEFFAHTMELVQKYSKPGMHIEHTIQTNGTKLDDEWCQFFKRHNFLVGISLDGPKDVHDTYRVDKRGEGTFDRVMTAVRKLQQYNVDFNILCTVHAGNVGKPLDVYRFFRDEVKVDFIQFIPIVERATPELLPIANRGWGDQNILTQDESESLLVAKSSRRPLYTLDGNLVTERSVSADGWGKFLIAVFDEWVHNDVGRVFLQMFDSALGSWYVAGASLCIHRETCGDALALEHNGDLYSCDHFVEPKYLLGNIKQEHMLTLVASFQQRKFGQDKRDLLPKYCLECSVRFACNGGCPRNRFIKTPKGQDGLNYLCSGYKAFFTHVDEPMRLMAALLKQGRYADEVMGILAQSALSELESQKPPELPAKQTKKRKRGRRRKI